MHYLANFYFYFSKNRYTINHRNIHSNIFLTKKSKFPSHRINPKLLNDGIFVCIIWNDTERKGEEKKKENKRNMCKRDGYRRFCNPLLLMDSALILIIINRTFIDRRVVQFNESVVSRA